jgi:hypothetical protein
VPTTLAVVASLYIRAIENHDTQSNFSIQSSLHSHSNKTVDIDDFSNIEDYSEISSDLDEYFDAKQDAELSNSGRKQSSNDFLNDDFSNIDDYFTSIEKEFAHYPLKLKGFSRINPFCVINERQAKLKMAKLTKEAEGNQLF